MPLIVRPVDVDADREALLGLLERNLTDLPHPQRFQWLYRSNPAGPARSWFACDAESGRPVGVASVFARPMWIGGTVRVCGQVGDFAIEASYRSLGPALLLQRATFEPVNDDSLALIYDCPPHERGMATFHRLGITPITRMRRYARLLRLDGYLQKVLPWRIATFPLAKLGNMALLLTDARGRRARGLDVSAQEGRFGEEFSRLDEREVTPHSIRGRRQAVDLNWRFRDDPLHEYRVLAARNHGDLVAYAVLQVSGSEALLVDLFGRLAEDVVVDMLGVASTMLRREKVNVVHALVADRDLGIGMLAAAGFRFHGDGPDIVPYTRAGSEVEHQSRALQWSFNHADVLA